MNRRVFAFILLVFLSAFLFGQEKENYLRLPVRVRSGDNPVADLNKGDFDLRLNGKGQLIADVLKIERSLAAAEKKNVVLSFVATAYQPALAAGVTYFVQNILGPQDALWVLTPKKMYRIRTSGSKEKILADIESLVKEDIKQFQNTRIQLWASYEKLPWDNIEDYSQLPPLVIRWWNEVKKPMMLPDLDRYRGVADVLAVEEGGRWFINFQQRNFVIGSKKIKKLAATIQDKAPQMSDDEMAGRTGSLMTAAGEMIKAVQISSFFPFQDVADIFMGADISFCSLVFPVQGTTQEEEESIDYEDILKRLAQCSGGSMVIGENLADGLAALQARKDPHYLLLFPLNKNKEELKVKVSTVRSGVDLFYKNSFPKNEMELMLKTMNQPKVEIADFAVSDHKLSFSLSQFQPGQDGTGVIHVAIALTTADGQNAFQTENTLRSAQKVVRISLPLPAQLQGHYLLSITAQDQVVNTRNQLNEEIDLN